MQVTARATHAPGTRLTSLRARLLLLVLLTVLPGLGLVLFAESSQPFGRSVVELGLVGVLMMAAAALGAEMLVVRRVRRLVDSTQRLAGGDLSARTGLSYGVDELGALSQSFDEMAAALEARQARAERAERDLHRSLAALRKTDRERRRLLAYLTRVQEQERSRIASDIHDDSIQAMTAVGIRLESVKRRLFGTDSAALDELNELEGTVVLSIARLRHLLFELRPPVLDREGLAPALRLHLERLSIDRPVEFDIDNRFESEPPGETRTILYRIAQEAVANVRKHARATRVDVLLDQQNDGFLVRISDDGVGCSAQMAQDIGQDPGHLGLTAMRERAELAGGWWKLHSSPRAGTTVEFWLPSHASEDETARTRGAVVAIP
jgi:signal transduction histidine kinase